MLLSAGNSIHTIRWANGLERAGVAVVLVSQQALIAGLSSGVRYYQLRDFGQPGYFLNALFLRKILRKESPDLLHAHYASGYGTTARLAGYSPLLLSVWGADVYDVPSRSRLHRLLVKANLHAADRVASTSHVMARQVQLLAPDIDDTEITPFGVDTELFAPLKHHALASEPEIVIGTVKTLTDKYGIDTLIDSFALLRSRLAAIRPNIAARLRLRIAGEGPLRSALEARANERGIGHVTTFTGFVPHHLVPDELRRLDIYVALSRLDSESFGVAVIEAGACGLPVVVSDAGGLPEVVSVNRTGFVVPRDNPVAASQALETLVLDPELRSSMGIEARRRVVNLYDWNNNVATMISLYRSMLSAHT